MPRKISKPLLFSVVFILLCIAGFLILEDRVSSPQEQVPNPVPVAVQATTTEYKNTDYGFAVTLPLSWKGFSIVSDTWKAYSPSKSQTGTPDETGALLSVRNPLWSTTTPRQDIPVMVFTLAQWDLLTQDKIHIGAAPINPSELSRNAKYVFALPARYNFAYPVGYEEVDTILQAKPLRGF